MTLKQKKLIIGILAVIAVVLIILFIVIGDRTISDKDTIGENNITPTPFKYLEIEDLSEEMKDTVYNDLADQMLEPEGGIEEYVLRPIDSIPTTYSRNPPFMYTGINDRKYNQTRSVYSVENEIGITAFSATGQSQGEEVLSINIEPIASTFNHVWITNNLILLIEKDSEGLKVDRIYSVNIDNGAKVFIAGSFPSISRFDLTIDPVVYNNGKNIIFTDNDGNLWDLVLVLR